jgi:hypothetical protein
MRSIRLLAHTHWDREWYLSFEEFRSKLVETLDFVLDFLERDPGWTHFHLDGQTQMIDDYLSVRPEREREVRAHIAAGRLSCGPWVTLVDEFSVSGESIIRNLEEGSTRAHELGGYTPVAYLPDQFGHVGQLPQLLRQAGLEVAVVWRGVPSEVTGSGFTWEAPDGSSVVAIYLMFGYWQGARMERTAEGFATRLKRESMRAEPFLRPGEPLLLMTGNDHERPPKSLPTLIADARERGLDVAMTSLSEFAENFDPPRQRIQGELRSAARANLLPNTYSVRPHQKIARAAAEASLERYAQPLAALVEGVDWPSAELEEAWAMLHLNGAHDSVCGCSTDAVAARVDARTARAAMLAEQVSTKVLSTLAANCVAGQTLRFNPSPFDRDGVPGLGWAVDGSPISRARLIPRLDGDWVRVDVPDRSIAFTLVDQADAGDLYTFESDGPALRPSSLSVREGRVHVSFDRLDAVVDVSRCEGEPFARVGLEVDNKSGDHRLQLLLATDATFEHTMAGSPFEIVERDLAGEGGASEAEIRQWPARGFVMTADLGILAPGVFEYEATDEGLAVTVMRCIGRISRPKLRARKEVAGPDVETPGAQLIGRHRFEFGILSAARPETVIEAWERFSLPLMTYGLQLGPSGMRGSSSDRGVTRGVLLDLETPALSTVTKKEGRTLVRIWNPARRERIARVAGKSRTLRPQAIETIEAELGRS